MSVVPTNPTTIQENYLNQTSIILPISKSITRKEYKVPKSITLQYIQYPRYNLLRIRIGEVRTRIQVMIKELSLNKKIRCVNYESLKIKLNQKIITNVICEINGNYVTESHALTQNKSTRRVKRANLLCKWTTRIKNTSEPSNLKRNLKNQAKIQTFLRRIQACSGRRLKKKLFSNKTRAMIEIVHLVLLSRNRSKSKSINNHKVWMNTSVNGHGKMLQNQNSTKTTSSTLS